MQVYKHHVIFDEISYDREELKDWYDSVKQYRTDFASVMNRIRDEQGHNKDLSHTKNFKKGLFDTIDTKGIIDKHVLEFEPVAKLVNKFNFDRPLNTIDVDVLIYRPGYFFHPHVDYHMNCGIMFPILPDEGAAPIDFYKMPPNAEWKRAAGYSSYIIFDRDFDYSYHYSLEHPSMFNGNVIHGVRNNDKERVFLRFKSLWMTYEDIINKCRDGKFINN
jgi:hypothetical protein